MLTLLAPPAHAGAPPRQDLGDAACAGLERPVIFGELDWESAQVATWLARLVLEHGFGCETDAIPGTVVPIYQGAIRGDVDVVMEVWTDNVPEPWSEAVAAGTVEQLGLAFDDADQGWYVPRYLVEGDAERGIEPAAPDLRSVFDLANYTELFRDPERPDKGRFYNCVIGWQCELINTVKLHAYDLADDYTDFKAGTGVALAASLEGAYLRGEPWVGYYWGPTWVLGRLDLLKLDEPPFEPACWEAFTALLDTPEAATEACAYPTSTAVLAFGSRFKEDAPDQLRAFFESYHGSSGMLSAALGFMHANDVGPRDAARHLLMTRPELLRSWVDEAVAARVEAALAD
ncbi:MAG TPA: ABC transporter substrate-binding protein [Trueperaceae bacterium]|nr:ABC transporter substrate-binding protein [Trueperaceae bacterium]